MTRPIKFRAWDKRDKEMFTPSELLFSKEYGIDIARPNVLGIDDWRDATLMQFTGLLDKNGTPIYEGDIIVRDGYVCFDVGIPNYRGTVEWGYSRWQVILHCINPSKNGISDGINYGLNDEGVEDGKPTAWEVIGNIYENPDLI